MANLVVTVNCVNPKPIRCARCDSSEIVEGSRFCAIHFSKMGQALAELAAIEGMQYVDLDDDGWVTLDGNYTSEQLRALVGVMERLNAA